MALESGEGGSGLGDDVRSGLESGELTAAVVFDLDGVLVDTEPLKARAHRTAVEARGGELGLDLYRRWMGGPHDGVIRAFLEASDLAADEPALEAYEATFRAAYRELLSEELAPTEGAEALLDGCREQGRRLALVTSSDRWMVEIVLPRLGGAEVFRAVITADDVEREKPAPDPYVAAVAALDVGGAVAVEDTAAGAASARAAGLPVIAVRHAFNGRHHFGDAAEVVDSLTPAEAFLQRVDRVASSYSGGGPTRP